MRTSALALASAVHPRFRPFVKVSNDNQWAENVVMLGSGPYMAAVADSDVACPGRGIRIPGWREFVAWATHVTYGGAGITTNRIKGAGTEPLDGGWGLNPGALTTSITDTALFDPSPEARVAGASTQQTTAANVPNDTYQVVVTITASAGRAITEFGLFDTTTAAPQTTTGSTISTTGVTSISVASTTGFTTGGFAQIDSEVVSITGSSAGTLTVARGVRGSTAATHATAANVVGGEGLAGGNQYMKGDFAVINLNNGDSIQFTAKVQYVPT